MRREPLPRSSARHKLLLLLLVILPATYCGAQDAASPIPEFDPSGLVRFDNLVGAESRRKALIEYVWPQGFPQTVPKKTSINFPDRLSAINADLVDSVELLECSVTGFDVNSLAYRLSPKATAKPAAYFIVHAGHMREGPEFALEAGLAETIEFLLKERCEVVVMQMPLVAWNKDRTLRFKNQHLPTDTDSATELTLTKRGTSGHNELFEKLDAENHGHAFSIFLEPVVQVVNLLESTRHEPTMIGMIGLSGGGWTTHMVAAVDPRIDVSIPVAGALPLYAREFSPGSHGDQEQFLAELFEEIDTDGDGVTDKANGVASWLEIFALGAIRESDRKRRQIQVLNYFDSCCFSGPIYASYAPFLEARVKQINQGEWAISIDKSHHDHVISPRTIEQVIAPLLHQ